MDVCRLVDGLVSPTRMFSAEEKRGCALPCLSSLQTRPEDAGSARRALPLGPARQVWVPCWPVSQGASAKSLNTSEPHFFNTAKQIYQDKLFLGVKVIA